MLTKSDLNTSIIVISAINIIYFTLAYFLGLDDDGCDGCDILYFKYYVLLFPPIYSVISYIYFSKKQKIKTKLSKIIVIFLIVLFITGILISLILYINIRALQLLDSKASTEDLPRTLAKIKKKRAVTILTFISLFFSTILITILTNLFLYNNIENKEEDINK